jgi:hypothetical protein
LIQLTIIDFPVTVVSTLAFKNKNYAAMFSSALQSIGNYSNSMTIEGIMATFVSVRTAMTAIMETMMKIIAKTG